MSIMKKIKEWFKRVFSPPVPTPTPKGPTFVDNFKKLDTEKWTVSTWTAPGVTPTHKGSFLASNVAIVDGALRLAMVQSSTDSGIVSNGAELASKDLFHYGTFEWEMRASSTADSIDSVGQPISGSVTGCFIYFDSANTEIDFEVEGNDRSHFTQITSWVGESMPSEHTKVDCSNFMPHNGFHRYKFIWQPGKIEFFRDDALIGTHTRVVPSLPARVMMNHWGTDNINWGGGATSNIKRYMWVKNFNYTPLY